MNLRCARVELRKKNVRNVNAEQRDMIELDLSERISLANK